MQRLGDVVLEVLEELAIDARELALAGEFARERKRADRDWNAINAQLRRMVGRREESFLPRDWCAGELYLVKG